MVLIYVFIIFTGRMDQLWKVCPQTHVVNNGVTQKFSLFNNFDLVT